METILRKMGYRKMKPKLWGKPVGYILFTVEQKRKKWILVSWIKGVNPAPQKNIFVNDRTEVTDEQTLKTAEAYTAINRGASWSDFSFLTPEEVFSDLL